MGNSAFNQQTPLTQQPRTPGGRLTLTTGTPVMTAEAAAQTTIYYTPYVNDQIPIYDGSGWVNKTFTELSLAMAASANWAADTNYDLYVVNDGGTLRLGTGAAWTNATTRSESLTRVNGILTNAASMTLRYAAASTLVAAANTATYVGTFRTTASTGTTTWEIGGEASTGDPVKFFLWNAYNRVRASGRSSDTTDSWTYATATWRSANNSTNNRVSWVQGLNEDCIEAVYTCGVLCGDGDQGDIGVGIDTTSAKTQIAQGFIVSSTGGAVYNGVVASYAGNPGIGYHYGQAVEIDVNASTTSFYGDAAGANLMGGIRLLGMF